MVPYDIEVDPQRLASAVRPARAAADTVTGVVSRVDDALRAARPHVGLLRAGPALDALWTVLRSEIAGLADRLDALASALAAAADWYAAMERAAVSAPARSDAGS